MHIFLSEYFDFWKIFKKKNSTLAEISDFRRKKKLCVTLSQYLQYLPLTVCQCFIYQNDHKSM